MIFRFAEELIDKFEENKENLIGKEIDSITVVGMFTDSNGKVITDESIEVKIGDYIYSALYPVVGLMEIEKKRCSRKAHKVSPHDINKHIHYKKKKIVGYVIERFSHWHEVNASAGESRPEDGDYFSIVSLELDSGERLCFCGEDAISDGYTDIWLVKPDIENAV